MKNSPMKLYQLCQRSLTCAEFSYHDNMIDPVVIETKISEENINV